MTGDRHHGTDHRGGRHAVPRSRAHVDHRTTVVVPSHHGHLSSFAFGLGLGAHAYAHGYGYSRYAHGYPSYYGYPDYYGYSSGYYDSYVRAGHARLRIMDAPRDAEVYVDGYYAGMVNDFDGVFQHLELTPGPHRIEIVAYGFEPVVFDVRAVDGRTITYRAHMIPLRP